MNYKISMFKSIIKQGHGFENKRGEEYVKDVDLIEFLTHPYHKEPTQSYRQALKYGDKPDKGLGLFITPAGTFKNRWRKKDNFNKHSGIMCLDFDAGDNPDYDVEEMFEMATEDPFVMFAAKSLSGKGVYSLVKIPASKKTHLNCFLQLKHHYQKKYGLHIDVKCKDLARARFPAYNESYYHKPYCQQLQLYWIIVEDKKRSSALKRFTGTFSDYCLKNEDDKQYDNGKYWHGFKKHNRNFWVYGMAGDALEMNITQAEAESVLLQYVQEDFTENEIKAAVKSAYRN